MLILFFIFTWVLFIAVWIVTYPVKLSFWQKVSHMTKHKDPKDAVNAATFIDAQALFVLVAFFLAFAAMKFILTSQILSSRREFYAIR